MAGFIDPSAPPMMGGAPNSGPTSLPTTTVEMSIRCAKLKDTDILSKSDPVAIIFDKPKGTNCWREAWRAEMILNDLNPSWKKTWVHEYRFEGSEF